MATLATDTVTVLDQFKWGLHRHDSEANRAFIVDVFRWMTIGLLVTGAVASYVGMNPQLVRMVVENRLIFYGLLVTEFLLVLSLAYIVHSFTAFTAGAVFIVYALLNGLTMSVIFLVFSRASIASAFFVTAGTFGVMSAYGYVTQSDLTTLGNLCLMGLVGLVIASGVNLYFENPTVLWATTYVGVLVFVGLTAYDTQKIKQMNLVALPGSDEEQREAVLGALSLYLDFINLFLDILRIMGRKRD